MRKQINFMNISKITIRNFRSIEKVEELEINPFNVFVGQNNHGKTNLFEAIEWFFVGGGNMEEICFMKDTSKQVSVEIEFTGLQKALEWIENDKQKKALSDIFDSEDTILLKRDSAYEAGEDRQLFNPKTKKWENTMGRDTAWRQFLPTFEYVSTKKFLEDVAKYGKATPISRMLSSVLEKMLEVDENYIEFKKMFNELFGDPFDPDKKTQVRKSIDEIGDRVAAFLKKQFPDTTDVKFKVENPELEDLFKKFKTTVNDGIENDASEKGDGMQRALMLAIIQAYAVFRKNNGESNSFLFLIDEAELHLHPTAQRSLKNALLEVATAGDQVLVNTHSSVLVADNYVSQAIFKVEKVNKITAIDLIKDLEKPAVIFELLGGSPTDLLLPSNILIVEGYSELKFLRKIIERFYPNFSEKIQIVPANGDITKQDKSIKFLAMAYEYFKSKANPYSNKVVLLVDGPNATNNPEYVKFGSDHPELKVEQRYFELPVGSLEEYYPSPYKADPSSVAGRINGKNILAEEVSSKISQTEFETSMPIIREALLQVDKLSFGK